MNPAIESTVNDFKLYHGDRVVKIVENCTGSEHDYVTIFLTDAIAYVWEDGTFTWE